MIRGKSSWLPTKPDPTPTTPFSSPTCSSVRSYPHDFFSGINKTKHKKERVKTIKNIANKSFVSFFLTYNQKDETTPHLYRPV